MFLQKQAAAVNAHVCQFPVHTGGLCDLFAGALATGKDSDGIGVVCEITISGIDSLPEGEGRSSAVDTGTQYYNVTARGKLTRVGGFQNETSCDRCGNASDG